MHVFSKAAAVLLLSALSIGSAHSQQLKDGALSGEVLSASAVVSFGTTGSVLLVPNDRFYVLTQACREGFGTATLAGSTLGPVVTSNPCLTYTPGIAFQPGEEITFTAVQQFPGQTGSITISLTGVLVDPNQGGDDDD